MTLIFTVDGDPKGKQRPRFWNGRAVTPQETRDYEDLIAWEAEVAGARIMSGPVEVEIAAYFPLPAAWRKKDRAIAAKDDCWPAMCRIDADNIAKVVLDALQGVCFKNDCEVTDLTVRKRYSINPRIEVTITSL